MDLIIERATPADAGEITTLQRAAFLSDAQLYGDPFLPSLTQTRDDIASVIERASSLVLVARIGHRIVGSVRADIDPETARISRLMTAPDLQGHGIGRRLMGAIEAAVTNDTLELSTGARSATNIAFYGRLGYRTLSTATLENGIDIVTMVKRKAPAGDG